MIPPQGVLETVVYATDLERAERFYTAVVGLSVFDRATGRYVFFRTGRSMLLVFNPEATAIQDLQVDGATIPRHGARGPGHVAFRIRAAEIDAWREHLARSGVALESEVRWPNGGHSLYFRDPAGNSVEVATAAVWGLPEEPSP